MSVYAIEADFNEWLRHGKGTRKAVVYNQHGPERVERHVEGTRKEILEQYAFYKDCYPESALGLVCEEYYEYLRRQSRHLQRTD